jgi:hypothetical protein
MSDAIKGSDGIERTIDEWSNYILTKSALCDGDDAIKFVLTALQSNLVDLGLRLDGKQGLSDTSAEETIADCESLAGDFFKRALLDSLTNAHTHEDRMKKLKAHVHELSKTVTNAGSRKGTVQKKRYQLGLELRVYIEQYKSLPATVLDLECFIEDRGVHQISKTKIYDELVWYSLNGVIKTYETD